MEKKHGELARKMQNFAGTRDKTSASDNKRGCVGVEQ